MILLDAMESFAKYGLFFTYFLIGVALLGMVLGILIAIFQNLKQGGLVAIGGFVGLIVLFLIGYAMSSSVVPEDLIKFIGPSGMKLSSAGLITFYIMVFVSFVLMVLGLLKSIVTGN